MSKGASGKPGNDHAGMHESQPGIEGPMSGYTSTGLAQRPTKVSKDWFVLINSQEQPLFLPSQKVFIERAQSQGAAMKWA